MSKEFYAKYFKKEMADARCLFYDNQLNEFKILNNSGELTTFPDQREVITIGVANVEPDVSAGN